MNDSYIEYLDKKFIRMKDIQGIMRWTIHTWQNWGADYGLELHIKGDNYKIITLTDSGYCANETTLVDTTNYGIISAWTEHLCPTNRDYPTD